MMVKWRDPSTKHTCTQEHSHTHTHLQTHTHTWCPSHIPFLWNLCPPLRLSAVHNWIYPLWLSQSVSRLLATRLSDWYCDYNTACKLMTIHKHTHTPDSRRDHVGSDSVLGLCPFCSGTQPANVLPSGTTPLTPNYTRPVNKTGIKYCAIDCQIQACQTAVVLIF